MLAVGDSVMLGAAPVLTRRLGRQATIQAAVNRQFFQGARLVRDMIGRPDPAPVVIIHLGNNGRFTDRELTDLVDDLSAVPLVVLTRLASPRDYAATVNRLIDLVAATSSNVAVLEWDTIVATHPEILYDDLLHMRPAGARLYADALIDLIARRCLPDPVVAAPAAPSSTTTSTAPVAVLPPRSGVLDRCGPWLPPVPVVTTTTTTTAVAPGPSPTATTPPASAPRVPAAATVVIVTTGTTSTVAPVTTVAPTTIAPLPGPTTTTTADPAAAPTTALPAPAPPPPG